MGITDAALEFTQTLSVDWRALIQKKYCTPLVRPVAV